MDSTRLVSEMVHSHLKPTDLKAINRARGFAKPAQVTPALINSYLLTPIGLEKVFSTLTPQEIAILHLIAKLNDAVSLEPFERVYPSTHYSRHGTYTQRYKSVLSAVQKQLVRKGVLLLSQLKSSAPLMERWRLHVPIEFVSHLPAPFKTISLQTQGDTNQSNLQTKLQAFVDKQSQPGAKNYRFQISKDGELQIEQEPFSLNKLQAWQNASLNLAIIKLRKPNKHYNQNGTLTLFETISYAFSLLSSHTWIEPAELDALFQVFYGYQLDYKKLCQAAWEWGILVRASAAGKTVYRLAEFTSTDPTFEKWFTPVDKTWLRINHAAIPMSVLDELSTFGRFKIADKRLYITPNFARFSKLNAQSDSLLVAWLCTNAPAFKAMRQQATELWGKQILHHNLLIARITDLALYTQITKTLNKEQYVVLNDEFIAFVPSVRAKVERLVQRAGHVVKQA